MKALKVLIIVKYVFFKYKNLSNLKKIPDPAKM